jgi:hypothetical protein
MYVSNTPGGVAADVNFAPLRNVYPGADGGTLATLGSASSPDNYGGYYDPPADEPVVDTPVTGVGGLQWWLGIAVLVGLMVFAARKTGNAAEFGNLRASTYNIAFITFVAVLGLTVLKVIAYKAKGVPLLGGFSQLVLAA